MPQLQINHPPKDLNTMPSSKDLKNYPFEFWTLTDTVAETGEVTIPCRDKAQATMFRQRYYSWRKLIDEPTLVQKSAGVQIKMFEQNNQWFVRFEHEHNTYAALREALANAPGTPHTTPPAEHTEPPTLSPEDESIHHSQSQDEAFLKIFRKHNQESNTK